VGANVRNEGRIEEESVDRWDSSREAVLSTDLDAAILEV
jgi:hypothetical protein